MSNANDMDLGPLTWVKTEIDLALTRADESLEQAATGDHAARLQFAQTHLHQARGALSIVGLDGLTQFASSLDQMLGLLARGERPVDSATLALGRRALAAIGNYLEELVHGTPDQPLRLAALYGEIAAVRASDTASPAELFFPDLSLRPARRKPSPPESEDDARQQLRTQRALFQRGLLQWLRNPADAAGPGAMRDALAALDALHAGTPTGMLWWTGQAFLEALVCGDLPAHPEIKRLCSQLDVHLRRLSEAPQTVPDKLMRELLYWISQAPARTEQQQAVRATWQLDTLLPEPGSAVSETPLAPLLKSLHALFSATKLDWDEFCTGRAAALPSFDSHVVDLSAQARRLGRPALDRLLAAISEFAEWLRRDPLQFNEVIALEVATAMLLAEAALDRVVPDAGFSAQVADTAGRLAALARGEAVPAAEGSPTLETARRAQERDALGQVSREIRSSLAQVEQILDDYFRNQDKRGPLAGLARPLKQIEGALALVGDPEAIALVRDAAATVGRFATAEMPPDRSEFEDLARRLSALGFYVEALQHGRADLAQFLEPQVAARKPADEAFARAEPEAPAEQPAAPAPLPGTASAQTTRPETLPPFEPEVATPAEAATTTTDDWTWDEEALEDEIETAPAPAEPPPFAPAAAPAASASAGTAETELDAELLEIFIEEAHEVLATIGEQLETLIADAHDGEALISIRRAFHTLKGSGRMVGLRDLGEAAWGIEQTLNRWLQLEWPPSPELHHLIDTSHRIFADWVARLERGDGQSSDVSALMAEAERLRRDETEPAEGAQAAPAATQAPDRAEPLVPELDLSETSLELVEFEAPVSPISESQEAQFLPEETSLDDLIPFDALAAPDFDTRAGGAEPPETPAAPAPTGEPEAPEQPESAKTPELADLPEFSEALEFGPAADHPETTESPEPLELSEPLEPIAFTEGGEVSEPLDEGHSGADFPPDFDFPELPELEPPAPAVEEPEIPAETHEAGAGSDVLAGLEVEASIFDFGDLADEAEPAATVSTPGEALPAAEAGAPAGEAAEPEFAAEPEISGLAAEPTEPAPVPEAIAPVADELADRPESPPPAAEDFEPAYATPEPDFVRVGDTEVTRPLYELFLGEARHHLSILHAELGRLQANPMLVPPEQAVRAAHTLAGISGTTRIGALLELARAFEHAIERLRDQARSPTREQTDLLQATNDTMEAMLAQVADGTMPLAVPELAEQLDAVGRERRLDTASAPAAAQAAIAGAEAAGAGEPIEAPPPVHDDLDPQLVPIFLEEATELIGELHATLRGWQTGAESADPARATARLLHTLKGSARMTGAMTLGEQLHHLESRLDAALKAGQDPAALIDELVAGLDLIEQAVEAMRLGSGPAPADDATALAATIEAVAPEAESGAATTLRVRADTIDRFVNEAGEIGIARTRIAGELRTLRRSLLDLTENVIRLRNQLREVEIQADVQMQSRIAQAGTHEGEFDPLEMDRYTRLQELTRMMAESVGDVTTVQQSLLRNLDGAEVALNGQARMSRDLQQALMQVRMVPFESLADRLYRVVRQTAKDLGKRANLDLRGGRIEIDRSVLEHMTAPLEHLLRNAVAHGIEPVEARRAAGKDEIGQLTLSVSQEGNEIAIVLGDDGAGLDYARIAERARASGLLGPDEVADERRLTNLIFIPGFSTAGNLSTVSGRGVGMDVVKSETAAVGGRIDIHATPGRGTEFRIYLPLTLAVTQALLVRAAGRSYAIPSSMIAQVLELKADALARLREDGGTDWQDERFAYRYLPQLLGDRTSQPEVQRFNWVLLLRAGAQTLALHVDALRGNQEIVVKTAGPQLARIVGVSGATVLGDGEIVLILNPVALASRGLAEGAREPDALAPAEPTQPAAAPDHQATILVVDDSLTVRKITGRMLEREGFRVVTAKDGVDALEHLLEWVPDVILSDIEMPRMDGFDLLRNIRADERTRAVPVIMITSRLADKHREYAQKLGADHYLGKPYEEEELLGLLHGYTAGLRTPA